ncbi:hypothetical protein K1719_002050 [Acacia pycnantha]|nr:hypothetical protein K1719_002050 [Acacia pycnantha]
MRPFRRTLIVELMGRQLAYGFMVKKLRQLWERKGKEIRLDVHTAQRARGKFARMCVELDLTRPLIPEFNVEGQVLSVVYESLGMLCKRCAWFGHSKEACAEFHKKIIDIRMEVEVPEEEQKEEKKKEEEIDLWKTVQRSRKPRRNPVTTQNVHSGSRF